MAVIFLRSTIIYMALFIIMRLMGKRQIGEMQPFEFTITILIAELACIPMSDVSIPLLYGVAAILSVFIVHQLLSLVDKTGNIPKIILSGKPSVVINKNGVDFNELKRNNLDITDLIESMRILGYFALDSVSYAIFEANGTLSAVENKELSVKPNIPVTVVKNGKVDKKSMQMVADTPDETNKILQQTNASPLKNVGVLTIDGNGRYYLQKYGEKYQTGYITLKKELQW